MGAALRVILAGAQSKRPSSPRLSCSPLQKGEALGALGTMEP